MSNRKSFADDGWAVWLDGNNNSTVYLNDYINPVGYSYIDVAVHVRGTKDVSALNVYIPFAVSEDELVDSSLSFQDGKIANATFNTGCLVDFMNDEYTSEIAYNGRTMDLVHVSKFGFTMKPLASGTLFSLNFAKLREYLDNNEAYVLFRLPHKSLDAIFHQQVDVGSILERFRDLITSPVVTEKYGYSVRINEPTLLPPEITRIGAFHRQALKKAVVTLAISDEFEVNDQNSYRIRRLEEDIYKDFVPEDFSCEDVIAYQWNQKRDNNPRGRFNFYFIMQDEYVSHVSMLIYMLLLLIVGAAANLFWVPVEMIFGL